MEKQQDMNDGTATPPAPPRMDMRNAARNFAGSLLSSQGSARILPIALGLAAAVLTLLAALVGIGIRESTYEAESQILVVPNAKSIEGAVSGADTLSRGGVIESLIAAYSGFSTQEAAFKEAGISEADRELLTISPQQVGQSAAIRFVAQSDDPELAVKAANAMLDIDEELGGFTVAFGTEELGRANAAQSVGASQNVLLVLALVFAAAAGLIVRWFVDRMVNGGARGSEPQREAAAQQPRQQRPRRSSPPDSESQRRPPPPKAPQERPAPEPATARHAAASSAPPEPKRGSASVKPTAPKKSDRSRRRPETNKPSAAKNREPAQAERHATPTAREPREKPADAQKQGDLPRSEAKSSSEVAGAAAAESAARAAAASPVTPKPSADTSSAPTPPAERPAADTPAADRDLPTNQGERAPTASRLSAREKAAQQAKARRRAAAERKADASKPAESKGKKSDGADPAGPRGLPAPKKSADGPSTKRTARPKDGMAAPPVEPEKPTSGNGASSGNGEASKTQAEAVKRAEEAARVKGAPESEPTDSGQ